MTRRWTSPPCSAGTPRCSAAARRSSTAAGGSARTTRSSPSTTSAPGGCPTPCPSCSTAPDAADGSSCAPSPATTPRCRHWRSGATNPRSATSWPSTRAGSPTSPRCASASAVRGRTWGKRREAGSSRCTTPSSIRSPSPCRCPSCSATSRGCIATPPVRPLRGRPPIPRPRNRRRPRPIRRWTGNGAVPCERRSTRGGSRSARPWNGCCGCRRWRTSRFWSPSATAASAGSWPAIKWWVPGRCRWPTARSP